VSITLHFLLIGFVAFRDANVGSWFIRATVVAFYKYSHEIDLHELFKMASVYTLHYC